MKWHCLLAVGVVFLMAAGDAADNVKKELARFEEEDAGSLRLQELDLAPELRRQRLPFIQQPHRRESSCIG